MQERRMFERVQSSLKINYEIVENPQDAKKATSKDIGGGGIRLALTENLDIGTHLKLNIELPEKKAKSTIAYGKVVWSQKVEIVGTKPGNYYETGIEFTQVDPLTLGRIFKIFSEKDK